MPEHLAAFSPDYASARERFRSEAARRGFALAQYPLSATGPDGGTLTIDVARLGVPQADRALVVSSGLHGVEGFLGSAVQCQLLREGIAPGFPPPRTELVLVHALNPYGFAWLRRCNEENVDLNRNFLTPGERYEGAAAAYIALNGVLNPRGRRQRPGLRWGRLLWAWVRYGTRGLSQAVAGGQYDFPQGLFYGGKSPTQTHQILAENLVVWIGRAPRVLHVDYHTGLGGWDNVMLLVDYPLLEAQIGFLDRCFGPNVVRQVNAKRTAYVPRGGLGNWCRHMFSERQYLYVCAEFGTYGPLTVLSALRAENQAHHEGPADAPGTLAAKERLKEVFCPSSPTWRSTTLRRGITLIQRALQAIVSWE